MSVELPEFITLDFFQKIFEINFASKIRVDNFWGEFATKKGDNYASDMFRVTVDYEVNDVKTRKAVILKVNKFVISKYYAIEKLIMKVMPSGEIQQKVMVKNNLYPREIHAYTQLLEEIYKLVKKLI